MLTSAVTAISRAERPAHAGVELMRVGVHRVVVDSTVMFGGAVVTNDSRDRPPHGSGNVGRVMMICLACGHVSSPKFCSVRMLS